MTWQHRPLRPSWRCAADGVPWPCHVAKADLRERHAPRELGEVMVEFLYEAAADVPNAQPGALWHQLVAWTENHP